MTNDDLRRIAQGDFSNADPRAMAHELLSWREQDEARRQHATPEGSTWIVRPTTEATHAANVADGLLDPKVVDERLLDLHRRLCMLEHPTHPTPADTERLDKIEAQIERQRHLHWSLLGTIQGVLKVAADSFASYRHHQGSGK